MAKRGRGNKDTLLWLAGGAAVLVGGLLVFRVLEIRPEFPFIGAGDYWQDQGMSSERQVVSSPNDAFVQGEMW